VSPRVGALGVALLLVGGGLVAGSVGAAAAVDISLDFTAAAPLTYDHSTGGGAYDNRTVGRAKDIVESLEGSDFRCGDIVTFLTRVQVGASVAAGTSIEIDFQHLADTTGQAGVGFSEIVRAQINAGDVGGEGPGGTDLGITGGGSPSASLVSQSLTAPLFTQKALLLSTVRITGLGPSTSTVLRLDARVACDGTSRPTGNLQAAVAGARVVAPSAAPIRVGNQTIPFRMIASVTPSVYVEEAPPSTTVPPTPPTTAPSTACEITIDEEFVVAGVTPTVRIQGGTPGATVDVFVDTGRGGTTPVTLDAAGSGIVPVPVPLDADVGSTVTVTVTNDPAGTCTNFYTVLADTTVEPTTTTTAPEVIVEPTIPDQPGPADIVIDVDVDNTGDDPEEDPGAADPQMIAECTQQGAVVFSGSVPLSNTTLPVGGSTRGRFSVRVDPANGELICEFDVTAIPEGGTERVPINESELTVDVTEVLGAGAALPATGADHGRALALVGLGAIAAGLGLTALGRRRRPLV
jgi:LPXTG-motif cell wall-anchored protein